MVVLKTNHGDIKIALDNAYAMNEGKRLFNSYNYSGCHAHGRGAIGPALMDDRWIYGAAPANQEWDTRCSPPALSFCAVPVLP